MVENHVPPTIRKALVDSARTDYVRSLRPSKKYEGAVAEMFCLTSHARRQLEEAGVKVGSVHARSDRSIGVHLREK